MAGAYNPGSGVGVGVFVGVGVNVLVGIGDGVAVGATAVCEANFSIDICVAVPSNSACDDPQAERTTIPIIEKTKIACCFMKHPLYS